MQINRLGNGSCIVPSYLDTKTRGGYLWSGYGEDVVDASCYNSCIEFRVNLNSMLVSWEKNKKKKRVMGRGGEGIRIRCFFRTFLE